MTKEIQLAEELIDFIHHSPTAFHAVENTARELDKNGYKKLDLTAPWTIEKGVNITLSKMERLFLRFKLANQNPKKQASNSFVRTRTPRALR